MQTKARIVIRIFMILICTGFTFLTAAAQQEVNPNTDLQIDGITHSVSYYIPQGYSDTRPAKLIVGFHGCNGNASDFRDQLIDLAEQEDAIILCPDNKGARFNADNSDWIGKAIELTARAV